MPLATAIQSELVRCGARLARPGEFTLRAFLSARIDLLQAEAVLGLVHAGDRPALRVALEQFAGGLSRPILHGREALLDLLADLEAGLDFVHEDIRFVTNEELHGRLTEIAAALQVLAGQLGERAIESRSLRVVLLGPVNAGKSSLFNALVGGRAALVSDVAPTTRDYVSATVFIGRYEIELIDTAGLDTAADDLSQRAAQQREAAMQCADLLVLCVPAAWRRLDIETPPLRTVRVRTRHDEAPGTWDPDADCHVTIQSIASINTLRAVLESRLRQLDRVEPGRFAITTRTRAGLDAAIGAVREAIEIHREVGEPEFVAPCVREAVDALGELVGAVYTNDLLDRVFSRFCIGK
jgi:tRNA modification GTPase